MILDPHTVQFVLPDPDAAALVKLGYMPIANRQFYHAVAMAGGPAFYWPTLFNAGPWGTGPYKWVTGSAPLGALPTQVVLEANMAYWEPVRFPRLQRVIFDNTLVRHEAAELIKTSEGRVRFVCRSPPAGHTTGGAESLCQGGEGAGRPAECARPAEHA